MGIMKVLVGLIILWPLAGFLFNGLGRNYWSKKVIAYKATGYIVCSFIASIIAFLYVQEHGATSVHYFDFINTTTVKIPFDFKVDALSSLFLLILSVSKLSGVLLINLCIAILCLLNMRNFHSTKSNFKLIYIKTESHLYFWEKHFKT